MFNIYADLNILSVIAQSHSSQSPSKLFQIMKELKTIHVSSTPSSSNDSIAQHFADQYSIQLNFSQSSYIRSLPTNPELTLQHPSSLFLLDIPTTDAASIQSSYGVFCLGNQQLDIPQLIDTNDEISTSDGEQLPGGWTSALRSLSAIPSNAILLTDRYLFAHNNPRAGEGLSNVRAIMDALLPQHFSAHYFVTIVFDLQNIHPSLTFNNIAIRLNRLKSSLKRNYPIHIEVLAITPDCRIYSKLHNRRIISNYFLVKVEHKLAAFNGDRATSLQTITPQALFTDDSLLNHSTPPLKSIDQMLAAIRDFSQEVPQLADHSIYRYSLDGRLFDSCRYLRCPLLK